MVKSFFLAFLLLLLLNISSTQLISQNGSKVCHKYDNQEKYGKTCSCLPGSHRMYDNVCRTCPDGTDYNPQSKICVSRCQDNKIWSFTLKECICAVGTHLINGRCKKCQRYELFNQTLAKCTQVCSLNQTYDQYLGNCRTYCFSDKQYFSYQTHSCVCHVQYHKINGTCQSCPQNYQYIPSTGECQPWCGMFKVRDQQTGICRCTNGYLDIQGRCGHCNANQIYNPSRRACQARCGPNQIWSNDKCVCHKGYYSAIGQCIQCSTYQVFNPISKKCEPSCGEFAKWIQESKYCECMEGYYMIYNKCGKCPSDQIYDPINLCCFQAEDLNCPANQFYNYVTRACQCMEGFYIIEGNCSKCSEGFVYEEKLRSCRPVCKAKQEYSIAQKKCVCGGNYYVIDKNGTCGECPSGTTYDRLKMTCNQCPHNQFYSLQLHKCICVNGLYIIDGLCGRCPSGYQYNSITQKCYTICGSNEVYLNEKCVCKDNFYRINQICAICPSDYRYNSSLQTCQPICGQNQVLSKVTRSCVCIDGYNRVEGSCIQCQKGYFYVAELQKCIKDCQQNQVFSTTLLKCICIDGYYPTQENRCGKCPQNTFYDEKIQTCTPIHTCPAQHYKVNGTCWVCPKGHVYDEASESCLKLVCEDGYFMNFDGLCEKSLSCPENSYFAGESFCCLCNQGYILLNGKCTVKQECPRNSYMGPYGQCVCNAGCVYYEELDICDVCRANQIYTGTSCICKPGYVRNSNRQCTASLIPISITRPISPCQANEQFSSRYGLCVCVQGAQKINGKCVLSSRQNFTTTSMSMWTWSSIDCPPRSSWNGKECVCNSGYYMLLGACFQQKATSVKNQMPVCLAENSEFNGVFCSCKEGYVEIFEGTCGKCPSGTVWDGNMCRNNTISANPVCQAGYTYNNRTGTCTAYGINCGDNSNWNGVMCVCNPGFHYMTMTRQCIQCPTSTEFDGNQCSPISYNLALTIAPVSCNSNEILINGQCTCRDGWYRIMGRCYQCPAETMWNGVYCQARMPVTNWCMGKPFTQYQGGSCACSKGFMAIEGCCMKNHL